MYNGLEIDMLSVGCADSILVSKWNNDVATRVLVDGACKGDYESVVKPFLVARGISHLHAIVCSHPHDDHAAGLVELVKSGDFTIGSAFLHVPQWHVNPSDINAALSKARGTVEARIIEKSLDTAADLVTALNKIGVAVQEPFTGTQIGCLTVVGPSQEYYEELIQEIGQAEKIFAVESARKTYETNTMVEEILAKSAGKEPEYGLFDDPEDSPENQSSTILATKYEDKVFVLTADAGVQALTHAIEAYNIAPCYWMQIPHHGSRQNINKKLIEKFSPTVAYISAEGSAKHPRRSVVNAFKTQGAQVFSTHYPDPGHLRVKKGAVPSQADYGSAVSLWNK
jgi:beta-lactamase superfamily II metal-dependent hydrolase